MAPPGFRGLRVLVTGGAGFIGSHLVDALLAEGAAVRVLDDFSTGRRENLAHCLGRIELIEGDIRDSETCRRAADGVAFLFHQAALGSVPRSMEDPASTIAVNVAGTANVFAAGRDAGVRRLIYASSSSVYGDRGEALRREGNEGQALSPYALSKAMGEQIAGVFGRAFRLESIGLRYFNVFGPRQSERGPYAAVVPRFLQAVALERAPTIYGDGDQSRDFTYVADAVSANLLAAGAASEACGRAYNIGGGVPTSIHRLAEAVMEICGKRFEAVHEPSRPGDVRHALADLTAAGRALAYRPETDLRTGLERTWDWFRRARVAAARS